MRLPRYKVQELMLDIFGLEISTALIDQTIKQTARSVEPLQKELVEQLEQAELAYADETSWAEGVIYLWFWVLFCSHTVLYFIGKRTKEMFNNALASTFTGILRDVPLIAAPKLIQAQAEWLQTIVAVRLVVESFPPQPA